MPASPAAASIEGKSTPERPLESSEPMAPIEGLDLRAYARLCRTLVSEACGSVRMMDRLLTSQGLTAERWAVARDGWTRRIAHDPEVRAAFHRFYLEP